MRLRRSDFAVWDYPKRRTWREIKFALRRRRGEVRESDDNTLAWALKRANGRGVFLVRKHATFLAWMVAVGEVAIESDKTMGHQARDAIRRIMATTTREETAWMQSILQGLEKGANSGQHYTIDMRRQ